VSEDVGPRILLTTVCKPYGVADEDAEAVGMQMGLPGDQITRGQHAHFARASFWTFPLYFLGENISVPDTVLISPVLIDFLLLRASGIPMLEAKYKVRPEYQEYQRTANTFFPWFSRKA
jgi:hypothetical protein